MDAYAIINTGGKQYRVQKGDILKVEIQAPEDASNFSFGEVLAVSDGTTLTYGSPLVEGVSVSAEILEFTRGPKLISFKKKRRKGYKRQIGHRQELMVVRINGW